MSAAENMRENAYSWEMERALLGGLILDPTQIADIAETIRPGDFTRPQHAALFALLAQMVEPLDAGLCAGPSGFHPFAYPHFFLRQ